MPTFTYKGEYELENGNYLTRPTIQYEIYGELNPEKNNIILLCHTLFGGIDQYNYDQYWFIGPGKPIDTNQFCIIMMANLGASHGSTSPKTINPSTNKKYGTDFPAVTIHDSVGIHRKVLEALGIRNVYALIGGSFGGFTAFCWLTEYPQLFNNIIIFESDIRVSQFSAAAFALVKNQFLSDPKWNHGDYQDHHINEMQALQFTIRLNRLCQVTPSTFDRLFANKSSDSVRSSNFMDTSLPAERWILKKTAWNYLDPNSMLCTLNSSSNFDLERSRPQYIEQWKKLRSNIFLIACNQDVEYTITKMNSIHEKLNEVGTKSHFFVIDSELGHGAFLSDQQAIEPIFKLMRSKELYPT